MRGNDLVARILGVVVFLGGVGLLAFSFATAYHWFTTPSAGVRIAPPTSPEASATSQLGVSALELFVRLSLLLIMTIIGSLLAGRGAQIYFAGVAREHPAIYPKEE
jgi:hypothetical protein